MIGDGMLVLACRTVTHMMTRIRLSFDSMALKRLTVLMMTVMVALWPDVDFWCPDNVRNIKYQISICSMAYESIGILCHNTKYSYSVSIIILVDYQET